MKWFKAINTILAAEPEPWLCYIHGQQLKNLPHLRDNPPSSRNVFFSILAYFRFVLKKTRFSRHPKGSKQSEILFFSGSLNQHHSLVEIFEELQNKKVSIKRLSIDKSTSFKDYEYIYFTALDAIKSLLLFFYRAITIKKALLNSSFSFRKDYLNIFLTTHIYLISFFRLLSEFKPLAVVVSNDHNFENRCLIAVARQLGITTVYVQHATVSNIFPALTMDYAFLDGQYSKEIYEKCSNNKSPKLSGIKSTKIYLTGQQKKTNKLRFNKTEAIGVAVNSLDDINDIVRLLESLIKLNYSITVRWHPTQPIKDVNTLKNLCQAHKNLSLSDPNIESVNNYFDKIEVLIAGNSSIHLEAAISGVLPVYYETKNVPISDYYGFVKYRLCLHAKDESELINILNNKYQLKSDDAAVKYYSDTFGTKWQGREGELVAKLIYEKILCSESNGFNSKKRIN